MHWKMKSAVVGASAALALAFSPATAAEGEPGHKHGHGEGILGGIMKKLTGDDDHGHGDDHGDGHGHAHAKNIGRPGDPEKASRTVEIRMGDNFYQIRADGESRDLERLEVRRGETVRFVVVNDGVLLHEFNIGEPESHIAHQKEMQTMLEHGMITPLAVVPEKMAMDHGDGEHGMAHDDPNAVLLAAGESGEIVWTFETDGEVALAENLEFACNIPGHYAAGMVGDFVVTEQGGAQ